MISARWPTTISGLPRNSRVSGCTSTRAFRRGQSPGTQEANRKLGLANAQTEDANVQLEETNAHLWQEIEERQRTETLLAETNTALRESEARYRGLVELAPDAVLAHQDWQIVYANAAALRLFGAVTRSPLLRPRERRPR